ncbi:hypothetical protein D3C78_1416060 [compost metagenome]
MTRTPRKPSPTAVQRWRPTFSFRKRMDRRVAKIGAVKPMVVASARGRSRSPWKISRMPDTPRAQRQTCTMGRRVEIDASPPLRLTTQIKTTGRPKIER